MKKQTALPVICCILGNVIWGFSYLFIRVALRYAPSEQLLAHRFLLSTVLMLLPLIIGKAKLSFKGKPLGAIGLLMLMQLGYYFFETHGVDLTNSTFAGLVLAVVPLGTILTGALFLKEYPTRRQALFCLLPIAGIVIITLSAGELGVITPLGVVYLFLCMCCSSLYKVANRKAAEHFSTYERTLLLIIVCAVFYTVVSLSANNWNMGAFLAPLGDISYFLPLLFLSVLCSIAANLLVNYAAGKLPVFTLASFGALSTLVSTVMGVVVMDEPVSIMLLAGAAMILVGVQQVVRPDKAKAPKN